MNADRTEIGRFVHALFCHADADGYVSLRTFEHQRGAPPVEIRAVQINGAGLDAVVAQATGAANRAAKFERPTVFAPPVCTFRSATKAAETDLANGLCLAVECDERPTEACRRLIGLLGGVTAIVASGGEWAHPETGELQPRLHVYVRLREPTRTAQEHAQLKRANRLAAALVGSDPSAVPLVHPLRWAGSVHRKGAPKLCRIAALQEFEIDLDDAAERLEQAARLALEHASGPDADRLRVALDTHEARVAEPPDYDPDDLDPDLEALADAIPNADEPRAEWIKVGLAFFAASDGSAAGFNAWDRWSRKSNKYHGGTAARWEAFAKSPPNRTTKGALVQRARRTDADFRLPSWGPAQHTHGDGMKREEAARSGEDQNGEDKLDALDALNRDYFVTMQGSGTVIVRVERDDILGRDRHVFMGADAFRLFFNNRRVRVGTDKDGEPTYKPLGSAWLTSSRRRTYQRMVLAPCQPVPTDVYNLWRGWGVEPKEGSWVAIERHWREIICGGDLASFAYLVRWAAHKVQHPERQAETCIVMRGDEGAGKGLAIQPLMRIFGSHALQIHQPKHLTGNFNAHLLDILLLMVDEAFWAGDHTAEGVLKGLITEQTLMIERKGVDAFQAPNRLGIAMSSNNDWVIPASANARRYLVLDVPGDRIDDRPYFKNLLAAIDGDETAALFHHLLNLDLSDFEIRDVPRTKALGEQKLLSGDSVQQWWFACLRHGSVELPMLGKDRDAAAALDANVKWATGYSRELLRTLYFDWCRHRGISRSANEAMFGKQLRKLCGGKLEDARIGGHQSDQRSRLYVFEPLAKQREIFLKVLNIDPAGFKWEYAPEPAS